MGSTTKATFEAGNCFKTLKEAERGALRCQAVIREKKEPEVGKEYWYWSMTFEMSLKTSWNHCDFDYFILFIGNVHETEEEAIAWGEKYGRAFNLE
jgi:hypothetical protein